MDNDNISGPRVLFDRANAVLAWVERLAIIAAGAILLAVMVLVTCDAFMRYALNAPLAFQYTLTEEYLLIAILLLAMPWGYRTGGYIRITGLLALASARVQNACLRVGLLASSAYVAVLTVQATEKFYGLWLSGETRIGIIELPNYFSWICLPIGLGLLTLRLLLIAIGPVNDLHFEHDPTEEL